MLILGGDGDVTYSPTELGQDRLLRTLQVRAGLDVPPALPDVPRATPPEAAGKSDSALGSSVASDEAVGVAPAAPRASSEAPTRTYTQFFEGYREAGGLDDERVAAMIFCESSWRIDPGGWHLGLAQFAPGTWATVSAITGYTDWRDPYHQGANVAVWASMVSPGTTAGWPNCW